MAEQSASTKEDPFNADDVARILRSIPAQVAVEAIERTDLDLFAEKSQLILLVETLMSGNDTAFKDVGGQLEELLGRSSTSINLNFIGLVQILPLQFKWIGIFIFLMVNILANTLSPTILATFLAALTGANLLDFETDIRTQITNLQGDLVRLMNDRDNMRNILDQAELLTGNLVSLDAKETAIVATAVRSATVLNDRSVLTVSETNGHLFTLLRRAEELFRRVRGFSPGN